MAPAGQLWSTVTDMAKWAAFLTDPAPAVLARETVDEMCAPVVISDLESWTGGYGLGLQLYRVGERVFVGHGGSMPGYVAQLAVHRRSRLGVIAFANSYGLTGTSIREVAWPPWPRGGRRAAAAGAVAAARRRRPGEIAALVRPLVVDGPASTRSRPTATALEMTGPRLLVPLRAGGARTGGAAWPARTRARCCVVLRGPDGEVDRHWTSPPSSSAATRRTWPDGRWALA